MFVDHAIALLAWYDRHRRSLPWRAAPGEPVDPYAVWLSETMLQQTTVPAVRPRFEAFRARWPDFAALAAADDAEVMSAWAGLGYYARARNMLRCAHGVGDEHGGELPSDEAALQRLPGIGVYTAAAVAAIAFERRAVVVDANVERSVARLFAIDAPLPGGREEIHAATARITPEKRPGDFAQAMMDLGATVCTPRAPACVLCPLAEGCAARASGLPERFPVKPTKRARPQRFGTVFWLERQGHVLLVRRPARGLLGGMRALPTGPWSEAPPDIAGAPAEVDWSLADTRVSHLFTHFALTLSLAKGEAEGDVAVEGEWWPVDRVDAAGLPTVFAKAARAIVKELIDA